jgi:lipopolysaccharide assembly outer membrane protein LptD (OstA)
VSRRGRLARLLAAWLVAVLAPLPAVAQAGGELTGFPGIKGFSAQEIVCAPDSDVCELIGSVDIETQRGRILADEVRIDRASDIAEAIGNVVLSFPGAVLAGTRLTYHLDTGRGAIHDVFGFLEQDGATLRADRIELLDKNQILVEEGVFTTCTQPTPYWSFRIARGRFDLGEYAYLRGVAFRAGKLPLFYTPYLVWPIKDERTSGFLFPEFSSSDKLGQTISVPYYWVLADNADLTLKFDGHTKVGLGIGAELRWKPTYSGFARGQGYWINDQVRGKTRYRFDWEHRQDLPYDFELRADIEQISDFDYVTDYETDLELSSTPQTRSTVDATKNWSWYSLSVRARRHEQYFTSGLVGANQQLTGQVINDILPEVEWRGRSQQIGRTPIYFSFEATAAGFSREILEPPDGQLTVPTDDQLVTTVQNSWSRLDFAPRFQLPVIQRAWLDAQVTAGWRGTWYSHRQDLDAAEDSAIVSEGLFRSLLSAGLTFSGPRFQRVFETPDWSFSPKLKHVIEPFVEYSWRPEASVEDAEVIRVDNIDTTPGELSDFRYGVRQRFFALREPRTGRASSLSSAENVSFAALDEQEEEQAQEAERAVGEEELEQQLDVVQNLNPVEIGSLEIFQRYSGVRSLTTVYGVFVDPMTGEVVDVGAIDSRRYSPIDIRARFNPTPRQAVDVGYSFDPANGVLTESRITTELSFGGSGYFRASWFRRRSANPLGADPASFLRTSWGWSPSPRLKIETEWDYNLAEGNLKHQYYGVRYETQCCTFNFGFDQRDFVNNERREFLLVVDLQGIGEVLDLRQAR